MPYVTGNKKIFQDVYESIRPGKKNVELRFLAGVGMVFISFPSKSNAERYLEEELKPLLHYNEINISGSEIELNIIGPLAGNYFAVIVGPSS
jgi:hypothetical protein